MAKNLPNRSITAAVCCFTTKIPVRKKSIKAIMLCLDLSCIKNVLCLCHSDKDKGPRRLMRKGLTLIIVGHINFILGAIVHGSILRHISKPNQQISTGYTAVNIISVTSGLYVKLLQLNNTKLITIAQYETLNPWPSQCQ